MDTKLTLKLDAGIIEKAKAYARDTNTSLSHLIEMYLERLTSEGEVRRGISPVVKSLSGILDLPDDYNAKTEYKQHLLKKYTR
jgi:hypothetical protein